MKFGVREICDVVFKAKTAMHIGQKDFAANQPVLYIDTATASTLEQATTTVYAQGGKGNTRLVTWEGEKTLTFTVTDALLSPISLSILSGAGLYKASDTTTLVHVHTTATALVEAGDTGIKIDLASALNSNEQIDTTAPVFVSVYDEGAITGELITGLTATQASGSSMKTLLVGADTTPTAVGKTVFVDFYITKASANVSEFQIDAASFGGNFYVEAATLFRDTDGTDHPCEITLPNVKIQSNFTFSMAATGDPSTFDFTMDAMPDYTMFDKKHKVMCVMQVVDDAVAGSSTSGSVMLHSDSEVITNAKADSTPTEPTT